MISDLIVEYTKDIHDQESQSMSKSIHLPKRLEDSFDESDSLSSVHKMEKYNYSPKYNILVDPEEMPTSKFRIEESKSEVDFNDDISDSDDDDSINPRMNQYSIDTNKITKKIDFGKSPAKPKGRHRDNTDAV